MLIYHVKRQTLYDQKLKISGTSSYSLPVPAQKAPERAGRGCSPAEGSCQWHLHSSLPGLHRSHASRLVFFVFPFNLPPTTPTPATSYVTTSFNSFS